MKELVLKVHPADNVIVALKDFKKGEKVHYQGTDYVLATDVPMKHKFVTQNLAVGDSVYMYGVLVGKAMQPIQQGEMITVYNLKHAAQEYAAKRETKSWTIPNVEKWKDKTFLGYHRKDGSVGTANYWLVIPMVFCENRNLLVMKEALLDELGYTKLNTFKSFTRKLINNYQTTGQLTETTWQAEVGLVDAPTQKRVFENVDGVKFLVHQMGCGGTRSDAQALCGLLAGYITHPNVAGATVLSLGCQHAQVEMLQEEIQKRDANFEKPLFVFEQQKIKSEQQLIAMALQQTLLGIAEANKTERKPAPLSKLTIGLECGGSDGFSGISANPALGHTSDMIVALGGTTILSEFPELAGVEQELINRCKDDATAKKFADLMHLYDKRAKEAGSGFEANPSPGNIKDGLITDAIKSAGAAKKGGTSPIQAVLDYPEKSTEKGLNLLCTPGNDVESTTGLAAAGCNIIVFTTGLGTPTGNPIAPVIKVSSNTQLFEKMNDIIDFNAGTVITGEDTIETSGEKLLDFIIEVASGKTQTKAMLLGQDDFIPWKRGVSL
jgi:altronate hydrolase